MADEEDISRLDLSRIRGIKADKDNIDLSLTALPVKRTPLQKRYQKINEATLAAYKYQVKKRNIR